MNKEYNPINKNDLNFGKKLRKARISCGLTQERVAELINCAPRYLASLENGQIKGSIPIMINLCNLYTLSPSILFEDYLTFTPSDIQSEITGYNRLNEEHKQIVLNSVSFLNKLENNRQDI